MLTFETCSVCRESHALKRDGTMSVHDNAQRERCAGGATVQRRPARGEKPRTPAPVRTRSMRQPREEMKSPPLPAWLTPAERVEQEALRTARASKKPMPSGKAPTELEAAVDYAAENHRKRRNYGIKNYRDPIDRRIYAVGRPTFFSGGSPGNGKR